MREYRQYCAVARSLDVIGERWSLLIVRELLSGPKRYTDLLGGLPGIATDMLAGRLRHLEVNDVVTRESLPPPAATTVYRLTDRGAALGPILVELARWGLPLLGERAAGQAFHAHWLIAPLTAAFRPGQAAGGVLTVRFDTDEGRLQVRVDGDELHLLPAPDETADVVVRADIATLAAVVRDPRAAQAAVERGRFSLDGEPAALRRFTAAFGLT